VKTYRINLDPSPKRLAHMDATLGQAGIAYTRVAAVDGRTLTETDLEGRQGSLSLGEVACLMSHRLVWQMIADDASPFAAVIEDDIHIAPAMAGLLADWEWIPPDADIVKLETILKIVAVDRSTKPAPAGCRLARLRSSHPGTAGYIIAKTAARRLLAPRADPMRPVDVYLFEVSDGPARDLVVYQLDPAVCIQDDVTHGGEGKGALASTIHAERRQLRRASTDSATRIMREIGRAASRIAEWSRARMANRQGIERRRILFADAKAPSGDRKGDSSAGAD
jgi:glycosyl transferase family 25